MERKTVMLLRKAVMEEAGPRTLKITYFTIIYIHLHIHIYIHISILYIFQFEDNILCIFLFSGFSPVGEKLPKENERHRSETTSISKGDQDAGDYRHQAEIVKIELTSCWIYFWCT